MAEPAVQKRIEEWLEGPYDEETKSYLRSHSPEELTDAFYTDLSFGTGGLRGLMGVGTNRINRYTIRMATQGLARYIVKQKVERPTVLIGYDSRHHSALFAEDTARVLAGNGIRAYLLKELRPTPFVSFATRYKRCTAGVMITASHNPAGYNGYKVYWSDGAQVVPPHDLGIIDEVHHIRSIKEVQLAAADNLEIERIDPTAALDAAYLDALRKLQLHPEENKQKGDSLKITFTSLHGTGATTCPQALRDWGFSSVDPVEAQIKPDGAFPTVEFPNPEYKQALQMGIDQLQKTHADLLIATDPDADRLGVVVMHKESPVILTGNEVAILALHALCQTLTAKKKMPTNGAFVTTIVSSSLLKKIAEHFGKPCFEVLTGFKYIGEKIHLWEEGKAGAYAFLFGAEESYGYLHGTYARDKDATGAACLIAEIALQKKREGKTLVDYLEEIYARFGRCMEKQLSLDFDLGKAGMEQMQALMERLRSAPPKAIDGKEVVLFEDYAKGIHGLPKSSVLLLCLSDKSRVIVRPSGTEPKIKLYAEMQGASASTTSLERLLASTSKAMGLGDNPTR